jgi:hypothetical protein
MFSTTTVASSTSMPMARLRPPRVMMFRVWPVSLRPMRPTRMARGMLVQTMSMLRQEPRNSRIISDTSREDTRASFATSWMAARTKWLWSKSKLSTMPLGAAAWMEGSTSFAASTTASVDASAFLRMARYVARFPLARTMLVWSVNPS